MPYRNDYTGKKPIEANIQQYMPAAVTHGSINAMPSNQNMSYPVMQSTGGISGGVQGVLPMPVSMPAAGAIASSGHASIPSGSPSVPTSFQGVMPTSVTQPGNQVPSTVENTFFTPGFLRTQIGRRIRVEFLLGTNLLTDRTGTLVAVGASYIVLKLVDSDDLMMCDIYSIKFVTILL